MAANLTVTGTIAEIFPVETFTAKNGNTYNYQGIVIDTQGYNRTDPVYVKFNVDRISTANFVVGQHISVDCNVTSRSYVSQKGITMWNTDLMVWKINQGQQQQQAAQPQQQTAPQQKATPKQIVNAMQGVPQLNPDGSPVTPQVKDDDLPF